MNILKRPIMRWHGGKWRLAPWIISHFPEHRVYVEPFGGAGSVLLRKSRSYAEVYNDLDGEAVNLFRVVRDRGDELRELLELTPFARTEFIESYEPSSDPLEQARRTCARSFMGFGSNSHNRKTGFRSNSNRNGTTPAHDWANYPAALDAIIERLRGVVIECRDAKEVIAAHDSHETLTYVDPPYVAGTRDKGSDYKFEMSDSDHIDLAMFLSDAKGMVIVSGYESKIYDDIYRGWKKVTRAALADGARKRVEVLWINKAPLSRLDNKQLALEARA
jgi:DNA adenine methylase